MIYGLVSISPVGAGCGSREVPINFARSLTDDRLIQVVADCKNLLNSSDSKREVFYRKSSDSDARAIIPNVFEDLSPIKVILNRDVVRVVLWRCVDDDVELHVSSIDDNPQVVLKWGDHDRVEESLWPNKG